MSHYISGRCFWREKKGASVSFEKLLVKYTFFRLQFRLLWTAERDALKIQLFSMSEEVLKLT